MTQIARKDVQPAQPFAFAGTGELLSYTVVQEPPEGYEDQAPYVLGLVRLDEGATVTAQITDAVDELRIGDRVEMVTRKLTTEGPRGVIVYGYKFRKLLPRT